MKKENNYEVLLQRDNRRPAKEYSRITAVERRPVGETVFVGVRDKDFTAWKRRWSLTVLGERIFWKKVEETSCTYKNGKLYGDIQPLWQELAEAFHLDWIITNNWVMIFLRGRKDLWKQVLSGRITNPEMLCKTFSKKYFKGAFSYKQLKEYSEHGAYVSLWEMYYYSTNPGVTLDKYLQGWPDEGQEGLFSDMLRMAALFNEKINPQWSLKRMREEHRLQIQKREISRLDSYSDKNIAPAFKKGGLSLILNERECYLEGSAMHNCIGSCYWGYVDDGTYLLAKGVINGEYVNLGIKCNKFDNTLTIDQVHTIYNGTVAPDTRILCEEWIENNKTCLQDTVNIIKNRSHF